MYRHKKQTKTSGFCFAGSTCVLYYNLKPWCIINNHIDWLYLWIIIKLNVLLCIHITNTVTLLNRLQSSLGSNEFNHWGKLNWAEFSVSRRLCLLQALPIFQSGAYIINPQWGRWEHFGLCIVVRQKKSFLEWADLFLNCFNCIILSVILHWRELQRRLTLNWLVESRLHVEKLVSILQPASPQALILKGSDLGARRGVWIKHTSGVSGLFPITSFEGGSLQFRGKINK